MKVVFYGVMRKLRERRDHRFVLRNKDSSSLEMVEEVKW